MGLESVSEDMHWVTMMGHEWTPVDCSTHVVCRRQKIGRRTSFWSMGHSIWSTTT